MSTTYSIGPMTRQWQRYDYDGLLFQVSVPGMPQAELIPRVAVAVDTANAVVDAADLRVHGRDPWEARSAPLVSLAWCDTKEGLVLWLDAFAASLDEQGVAAKLTPAKAGHLPSMGPAGGLAALSVMVSLGGWVPGEGGRAISSWVTDPAVRERLTAWALPWVAGDDDSVFLVKNLNTQFLPVEVARQFAAEGPLVAFARNPDVENLRLVSLTYGGRLVIQIRDPDVGWSEHVNELLGCLRMLADIAVYAGLRIAHEGAFSASDVRQPLYRFPPRAPMRDLPSLAASYYLNRRGADHYRVPDAYGLQLLTDDHLARAHDLSGWRISPLADGLHLVEAPDLAAWYAQDVPDQSVVDAAREDFGDRLILWDAREVP